MNLQMSLAEHRLIHAAVFIGSTLYTEAHDCFRNYQMRVNMLSHQGVPESELEPVRREAHQSVLHTIQNVLANLRNYMSWQEASAALVRTEGDSITIQVGDGSNFHATMCFRYTISGSDEKGVNNALTYFNVYRSGGACIWSLPQQFGEPLSFSRVLGMSGV